MKKNNIRLNIFELQKSIDNSIGNISDLYLKKITSIANIYNQKVNLPESFSAINQPYHFFNNNLVPSLDLVKSFANISSYIDSAIIGSIKAMSFLDRSILTSLDLVKSFANISSIIDEANLKNIKSLHLHNYDVMLNNISKIEIKPIFPEIPEIRNLYFKSDSLLTTYNDYIAVTWALQNDISNEDDFYKNIVIIEDTYHKTERKSFLSLEFFINLFLTIAIFAYQTKSSKDDTNDILQSIQTSRKVIHDDLIKIQTELNCREVEYYVVIKKFEIMENGHSQIIKNHVLYPNQKVRIVKKYGKMVLVEYFNHLTNMHEQVLCPKKYLRRIKPFYAE